MKSNLTIKAGVTLFLYLIFSATGLWAQSRVNDFAFWGWFQVERKTFKRQYAGFQYQVRFNENASVFDLSNVYFLYGWNPLKNLNTEVLYQMNINHSADQYTLYLGNTYKIKLRKKLNCYIRSAVQHTQNNVSGDYHSDKPLTEWRNRLRFSYSIKKYLSATLSAEPYLAFDRRHPAYISRVRFVAQINLFPNKYSNLSMFYLFQPDAFSFGRPNNDFTLGLTYYVKLPNKWKDYDKILKFKYLKKKKKKGEEDEDEQDQKDTFN